MGKFHESLNLAAIWKLPVVYVCENNQYAESPPAAKAFAVKDISVRAAGYGMPGVNVDGRDVSKVYDAAGAAIARAPAGGGPTLLVVEAYRHEGHYYGDPQHYRTKEEIETWRTDFDPLVNARTWLTTDGIATQAEIDSIDREVDEQTERAIAWAEAGPLASPITREEIYAAPEKAPSSEAAGATHELFYAEALREALRLEMERDPRVLVMGEDIAEHGGAFQVTAGLLAEFGPDRIRQTPISEIGIVGTGVGAALTGLRPVVELMYMTAPVWRSIRSSIRRRRTASSVAGGFLVVRTQGGSGRGNAAQHSKSLEAWFSHVAGLKVVMPATPADAKGLLAARSGTTTR